MRFGVSCFLLVAAAAVVNACNIVAGLQPAALIMDDGGTDAGGMDAGCTTPAQCPGGSECSTPECSGGACGLTAVVNGTPCDSGLGTCQAGTCTCLPADTCPDGCFDTMVDPAHCGTCANACSLGEVCIMGQCACSDGKVMCANVCVDTATDPSNCGACGHDCQGGACLGSACQPVTIASGQMQASGIAVDASNVYWTTLGTGAMDGTVMACAIGGCGNTPTTLASGLDFPSFLAVDATTAYWTSNSGVMACAKVGCVGAATLDSDANAMGLGSIAVDSTNIYWTNPDTSVVMQCAINNCSGMLTMLASGQNASAGIAVDAVSVYWVNDVSNSAVW